MEQLEHSTLLVEMQNDSNTIVKLGSVLYPHHMYWFSMVSVTNYHNLSGLK